MNLVLLYLVSSNMKLYFIVFYLYLFEKMDYLKILYNVC